MAALTLTLDENMSYTNSPEDPFYSPANIERLKKSIAQLKAGKGTEHELITGTNKAT